MKQAQGRTGGVTSVRHKLRDERGSALVMVMFLALLLTVLALAVMGATIGGAVRTETRENDVQGLHLAQKGLNEATAFIQAKVQAELNGNAGIEPKDLERILQELKMSDLPVTTEFGAMGSGNVDLIQYGGKGSDTTYYIDVTSSAVINGVNRKLTQRLTLDTYPDFLKYAFGSESNVTINGAARLTGNIYAGKQLYITNTAEYDYRGVPGSEPTLFPQVLEGAASASDITGEVHVQSLGSILFKEGAYQAKALSASDPLLENDLLKVLNIGVDKVKIKEQKKFVRINVEDSFIDKLAEAFADKLAKAEKSSGTEKADLREIYQSGRMAQWLLREQKYISPILEKPDPPLFKLESVEDNEKVKSEKEEYNRIQQAIYEKKLKQLDLEDTSAVYKGPLLIDGQEYKEVKFTPRAKGNNTIPPLWLIVVGDLILENYSENSLNISGNFLVTGNVIVRGKVDFDATIFALGETRIEDATIEGDGDGTLVLISKGKILINRVYAFSDNPVEIKAFFYTDSSAELYGVGSMFKLTGGFFAKEDLTINAVVGEVHQPSDESAILQFEGGTQERFQIIYNNDVFSQQLALPRVHSVNISAGPMKLVRSK